MNLRFLLFSINIAVTLLIYRFFKIDGVIIYSLFNIDAHMEQIIEKLRKNNE